MNVSKTFLRDFAFLANRYRWTPADIEDIKADTRANPDLVRYWTALATAHRAGYEQTVDNGYIRLQAWCLQQGLPDMIRPGCSASTDGIATDRGSDRKEAR